MQFCVSFSIMLMFIVFVSRVCSIFLRVFLIEVDSYEWTQTFDSRLEAYRYRRLAANHIQESVLSTGGEAQVLGMKGESFESYNLPPWCSTWRSIDDHPCFWPLIRGHPHLHRSSSYKLTDNQTIRFYNPATPCTIVVVVVVVVGSWNFQSRIAPLWGWFRLTIHPIEVGCLLLWVI